MAAKGSQPADAAGYVYVWRWRTRLPERRGERFRVIVRGNRNACLIEFARDGLKVITSRNALRRGPEPFTCAAQA